MINIRYKGIILAAGKGNRITPLNIEYPKSLLPICNKPIIEYIIEQMKEAGITEIYIVVGMFKEKLIGHLGDGSRYGVDIKYVFQESQLGIAHAIGLLEPYLDEPFILILGDIFAKTKPLKKIIDLYEEKNADGIIVVKKEDNIELIKKNFSVLADESHLVYRVIEKPESPPNNLKGCGIYLFNLKIFNAIKKTPKSALRNEYEITDAIQIFINDRNKVYYSEIVEWDANITYPKDLLEYNLKYLKETNRLNAIGKDCIIPANANINNSVIGANVKIEHPLTISDSIIFSDTQITSRTDICRSIIGKDWIIEL